MATITDGYRALGQEVRRLHALACQIYEDALAEAQRRGRDPNLNQFDWRLFTLLTVTAPFSRTELDRNLREALQGNNQDGLG